MRELERAALVMGTGAGGAQNTEDFIVERRAGVHQLGRKAMTQEVRPHIRGNRLLAGRGPGRL